MSKTGRMKPGTKPMQEFAVFVDRLMAFLQKQMPPEGWLASDVRQQYLHHGILPHAKTDWTNKALTALTESKQLRKVKQHTNGYPYRYFLMR